MSRRRPSVFAAAIAGLALSACQAETSGPASSGLVAGPSALSSSPAALSAKATTAPDAPESPASLAQTKLPADLLDKISIGLPANRLEPLLGPAALKRPEGDAALWRFDVADCALLVALHQDAEGIARVTHLAARDRRGPLPPERCLAR